MQAFIDVMWTIDGWAWDIFCPAILLITGLYLTIGHKGRFTFRLGTLWKNSVGTAFKRKRNDGGKGTISAFAAALISLPLISFSSYIYIPLSFTAPVSVGIQLVNFILCFCLAFKIKSIIYDNYHTCND